MTMLGLFDVHYFRSHYLRPMLDSGELEKTIPEQSTSPNQRYRTRKRSR